MPNKHDKPNKHQFIYSINMSKISNYMNKREIVNLHNARLLQHLHSIRKWLIFVGSSTEGEI